jgi:hypothetical protein
MTLDLISLVFILTHYVLAQREKKGSQHMVRMMQEKIINPSLKNIIFHHYFLSIIDCWFTLKSQPSAASNQLMIENEKIM